MATRNILDNLGNIIGTLTLPDETTEAQWQSQLAPYAAVISPSTQAPILKTIKKSATDSVTTSSSQPALVAGMEETPESGKYLVSFNGSISTGGASASGKFGIYIDDVLVAETLRPISCNLQLLGGLVTVSLNNIGVGTQTATELTLNGSQKVDVKFHSTNGGVIGFGERVMSLVKVG